MKKFLMVFLVLFCITGIVFASGSKEKKKKIVKSVEVKSEITDTQTVDVQSVDVQDNFNENTQEVAEKTLTEEVLKEEVSSEPALESAEEKPAVDAKEEKNEKSVVEVHSFSFNTLTAASDKEKIEDGAAVDTEGTGFIKVEGNVVKRYSAEKGVTSTEVGKASSGCFVFTVSGNAEVEIEVSSTGGSNDSAIGIIDDQNTLLPNAEGITTVHGTAKQKLTYKLSSGTYRVVSPFDEKNNRGARVYSVSIVEEKEETVNESSDSEWSFRFFGVSVGKDRNALLSSGKGIEKEVKLSSATFKEDGSINKKGGKFVADSPADGGSYYYTEIDPTKTNFYLQADVYIDDINPTLDGQEGFALMVRDSLGEEGVSGNWMANLVSVTGTKLPSPETAATIGVRAYTGIYTAEASDSNEIKAIRSSWFKDADGNPKKIEKGKTYRVSLEKTSYAYIVKQYDIETGAEIGSYTYYIPAKDSNATSIKNYADLNDPLTYQEKNKAYVALVVARGLNATFKNIVYRTSDWKASEWFVQPTTYVPLSTEILSSETVGDAPYNLVFRTNADGFAKVYVDDILVVDNLDVKAGVQAKTAFIVPFGKSDVRVDFTPDKDFKFSIYEKLSSYDTKSFSINVTKRILGRNGVIYVSPEASDFYNGREKDQTVDIITAFNHVTAGQTIVLRSGVYDLSGSTILVSRGRDGFEYAPITVKTEDGGFATLNFGKTGGGVKLWGSYWNLSKINITGTKNGAHGMQLAGSNCVLERVNFFNNGTSGLTVSGDSKDGKEFWPAYNLVKNCSSMNNADKALEDADGFCAKLTTGEGNVFDGCISAYNADDGWDLFAKVSTGQIGSVTIKNSVAYKNGYLMVKEGSTAKKFAFADVYVDADGTLAFSSSAMEMKAGNGNGFKMGGSSLPGGHILINSIAYDNKAKGIDSNSCSDIKVYDSTSFNNGSYNVAMYTGNKGAKTGFAASGVFSYRTADSENLEEYIGLQSQPSSAVYGANNYFWNKDTKQSENFIGKTLNDGVFISTDTSVQPARNADGSIDMHNVLMLNDNARADLGAGARGYFWGQTEATVWVIGDSTVSPFNDKYYLPREGYGEEISSYFNAKTYNLAHSGASSLDFTGMSEYQVLMNGSAMIPALGDAETEKFLIIGFGHNDEKTEAARYTNPNGNYKTEGSFANSLYKSYVKPALDRGVIPVLCTPIARLTKANTADSYNSADGHKTRDVIVGGRLYEGGDYADAIISMVKELQAEGVKTEYIDLTQATIDLNVNMGEDAQYLHSFTGAKYAKDGVTKVATGLDLTHTNAYGAKMNAYLISNLARETAPLLAKYALGKEKPSYEKFFEASVNPDYTVPEYKVPTLEEMKGVSYPVYTDKSGREWYGTVFGDIGGAEKITEKNFSAIVNGDNVTLTVNNNSGKIASGSDGFIFYYTKLPAGTNFILTGHATIEKFTANNQVSFGLMARDDLYIDKYVAITMGDYVASGVRNQGNIVNFGRKSGALIGEAPVNAVNLEKGAEVDLKIVSSNDGYALTFGENTVSAGFDYALTGIDSDSVYVGFYVVRNASITFSNINLELN